MPKETSVRKAPKRAKSHDNENRTMTLTLVGRQPLLVCNRTQHIKRCRGCGQIIVD